MWTVEPISCEYSDRVRGIRRLTGAPPYRHPLIDLNTTFTLLRLLFWSASHFDFLFENNTTISTNDYLLDQQTFFRIFAPIKRPDKILDI